MYSDKAAAVLRDGTPLKWNDWVAFESEDPVFSSVSSINSTIKIPPVILLLVNTSHPRRDRAFSRNAVLLRDEFTCQYCARVTPSTELTLDHILPKSQGGKTSWLNVVASCKECNHFKANHTPEEAGMRLLKEPHKPSWANSGILPPKNTEIAEYWKRFLC
jgi:hypothetical protein